MMLLQTDDQTIDDLRFFAKKDQSGVYDIYNNTHTRGGENVLEKMFRNPLSDKDAITKRASVIAAFASMKTGFPFDGGLLDNAEKYLIHSKAQHEGQKITLGEKEIYNGVSAVIELFHLVRDFAVQGDASMISDLRDERTDLLTVLSVPALEPIFNEKPGTKLSFAAVTAYDNLIRIREQDKVFAVLQFIYLMDALISVAHVASKRNFVFPIAHPKGSGLLRIEGVYHPGLENPVANSLTMDKNRSVVFLTGANMAGKSTFLRSFSTAVYIAHMGFPVAAKFMEFSVMDGVYTTINLPDNLGIGASHFYAEVLRVKKIAMELHSGKFVFVLFDELFRGTNVKDAHEGTVSVINAFATRANSKFIISSHIVEAAAELKQKQNIGFHYLPTRMKGNMPEYTYTLEEGVTNDRHGMIIIKNEGILEVLQNGNKG